MKNIKLLIISLFLFTGLSLSAQTTVNWSGTIPSKTIKTDTKIILTGDVLLTGIVWINSGAKVTIESDDTTVSRTIKRSGTGCSQMFYINSCKYPNIGSLTITGSKDAPIILDGGVVYSTANDARTEVVSRERTDGSNSRAIVRVGYGNFSARYVIFQNNETGNFGGAIWTDDNDAEAERSVTIEDCIIRGCIGPSASAISMTCQKNHMSIKLKNTKVYHNLSTGNMGGTIKTGGGTAADMTVDNCEIYENSAPAGDGGGIYWNAAGDSRSVLTVTGNTKIHHNIVEKDGGGMKIETKMDLVSAEIYENEAGNSGGGMIVMNYGGGEANYDGSGINLTLSSNVSIHDNKASNNGGGLCFYIYGSKDVGKPTCLEPSFDLTINGANIYKNTAKNGGGIAIRDRAPAKWTQASGIAYPYSRSFKMTSGQIYKNEATKNGGGLYIWKEKVDNVDYSTSGSNAGGGEISVEFIGGLFHDNYSKTGNGGGLGVLNDLADYNGRVDIKLKGSELRDNQSLKGNGGAIYADVGSTIEMTSGTLISNDALNGGGIYLTKGAYMSMASGIISDNNAIGATGAALSTAYHGTPESGQTIQGVGGGIYLAAGISDSKQTALVFPVTTSIGIYNNSATHGADDIFADGLHTKVTVPAIDDMKLEGYDALADGWYEDYIIKDSHYSDGTFVNKDYDPTSSPIRYKTGESLGYIYKVSPATASSENTYLSLSLGYITTEGLTVVKEGLNVGESAVFNISGKGKNYTVCLTGRMDGSPAKVTLLGLEVGDYTVTETGWSWAYTPEHGSMTQNIANNPVFRFKNTSNNTTPLHAEKSIINWKTK